MPVAEQEKKFEELTLFGLFIIPDDVIKKQRFLNSLSVHIVIGISKAYHPTYQARGRQPYSLRFK